MTPTASQGAGVRSAFESFGFDRRAAGVSSCKPCCVGTRIAVYDVLAYLTIGMTHAEIVDDFPELGEAHIRGCARDVS